MRALSVLSESSSVFLSLTSQSEVYRGYGAWKVVPRGYRTGRSPRPATFTSNSISGAKTIETSASLWYSSSGSRFRQPSGWQMKEKMTPGQLVTLKWDNGCFCYSNILLKEKEEGEKGEGGKGRGGEDGGKKEEEKGEERASILAGPEGTPAPHPGTPLFLPHIHQRCFQWREGVQRTPHPPLASSISSPRSSLTGPHLHTSCGFERITKMTSSAQRSHRLQLAVFQKGFSYVSQHR